MKPKNRGLEDDVSFQSGRFLGCNVQGCESSDSWRIIISSCVVRWLGSLGSLGSGFLDLKSSTGEENPSLVTGFDLSCEAVGIDKTLRCVWWSLCMLYIYRIKETHYIHVFKHVTGVIYPYLCWGHKRCCMKSDPLKL